jgi:hypothetical protein
MVDAGVKLKWYRPWNWRHPSHYFQRNHRKLLLIDERESFLILRSVVQGVNWRRSGG